MATIPDKIGKYKVIDEIARGGMGAIYKAEHPTLDRFVVIKKLTLGGQANVRERFRREAAIMMDFRNEYIVDVYDHFKEGASHYIVQEFVDGLSLEALLARERYVPERIALTIFRDACKALKYAHDKGVVHRDIKPGNLLVSKRGEVKLVDFGIARTEDEDQDVLTKEGMTLGTPSYMAPEQFRNTRNVDKRADIYSLGVLLYETTTGKRPFPGAITPETIRLIQTGRCKKPRRLNPALTGFTAALIRRMMRADPKRRVKDLGPIIRALDARLARIGVRDERSELTAYIGGSWTPPRSVSKTLIPSIAATAGVLLFLGVLALFARGRGWHYEYLSPSEYGAVRVNVRLPAGPRPADSVFVSAELFIDDGKDIPPYPAARFIFNRSASLETAESVVYAAGPAYAPPGTYRLKVQVGENLYWSSFYLESRLVQRADPAERDGRVVRIVADRGRPLPLDATVRAVSAADGLPVTVGSTVRVLAAGEWLPLEDEVGRNLQSGGVRKFMVEREGYYPATFSLVVQPFQSSLRIDCELVPYPAFASVRTELEGVTLVLDGLGTYRAWGPLPERRALPRPTSKGANLAIAPGRHVLSARYGNVWADLPFTAVSGDRLAFVVELGSGKRDLRLRKE